MRLLLLLRFSCVCTTGKPNTSFFYVTSFLREKKILQRKTGKKSELEKKMETAWTRTWRFSLFVLVFGSVFKNPSELHVIEQAVFYRCLAKHLVYIVLGESAKISRIRVIKFTMIAAIFQFRFLIDKALFSWIFFSSFSCQATQNG